MKKLIAGIGLMSMMLMVAGSADAARISGIKDSSTGTSLATWSILATIRNTNNTGITNVVASSGNSGGNVATSADDQSDTQITTGAAQSTTGVEGVAPALVGGTTPGNVANTNVVSESLETPDGADNNVELVDDSSAGSATSTDLVNNDIVNLNTITVGNTVDSDGNSGTNVVSSADSLSGTRVTSGASNSGTFLSQDFNLNIKEVIRTVKQRTP